MRGVTIATNAAGTVSVICPSYGRADRHALLYAAFRQQSYSDKELLVLDDSEEPSLFFASLPDPQVRYHHVGHRITIGEKRNRLCEMASGEIVAHFDDDDFYAPSYLETMVGDLGSADFVKLSRWLAWRERDGTLWDWDTTRIDGPHFVVAGSDSGQQSVPLAQLVSDPGDFVEKNTWGYGFSYLYRRSLWAQSPFRDVHGGEDYDFVARARESGVRMIHKPELTGLVLHTLHANSSSKIFAQRKLTMPEGEQVLGIHAAPWMVRR